MHRRAILALLICGVTVGVAHGGPKATSPDPADGAVGVANPLLQWTPGTGALFHDVYLGTVAELGEADRVANRLPFAMYWHIPGFQPGVTYYWRVDETLSDGTVQTGDVWTFATAPAIAWGPQPRDGDKWMQLDVVLSWQPGMNVSSHDVYLGADEAAVAARDPATFQGNQTLMTYTPATLQEQTTYYWAVDEIDNAGAKHEGDVWSFGTTGATGGLKAEYFIGMVPVGDACLTQVEGAIDHQWGEGEVACGLSDLISARWTADLEIPVTDTYTFITRTDDGARLYLDGQLIVSQWVDQGPTDASSGPIELTGGTYHSLVMEYYENGGGAVAELYWQTPALARTIIPAGALHAPVRAGVVYPSPGAADRPQALMLRWSAGDGATQHDVYFGDDAQAVAEADTTSAGIYRGRQALDAMSYDVSGLEWNTTYYWRVDEVNPTDPESPRKGTVWSFTTAGFIVVDDFEIYTNEVGERVFQTWIDGWGFTEPEPGNPGNGTNSGVGHDIWTQGTPYTEIIEVGIVHGGKKSMPLAYDNSLEPFYSETDRTWATPQNWVVEGVDFLMVHFRGSGGNGQDSLYVALEDSAGNVGVVVHPDSSRLAFPAWTRWQIPLSQFSAAGVDVTAVKKMIIGVGDRDNPAQGGTGLLYIDDIRVSAPGGPETTALFAEDFEGVPLGPNVDEGLAGEAVWTETPPAGWTIDESGIPGIGDPANDGVTEWAGWSFADKNWWTQTAGDQRRSEFTLGSGTVAIADPDEWDDATHADSAASGWYKTYMSTLPIDISAAEPGTLVLTFASSWRPEYDSDYHQTGNLTVSFDGGAPVELFLWESDPSSPNFKDDNSTNETITVEIDHPAGAQTMVLTFGLFDAGNDWWWAIDNLVLTGLVTE